MTPLALFHRLHSTYWFLPSVITAGAAGLAVLLTWVDRENPGATEWLGWAYGGGPEGARAMLSAVAGSSITVVSVTFSVMVVALTVASQHFGPRLLNSFMRDTAAQLVLGAFTGTFVYCLVVLRTVQGEGDDYSVFVPHLSVTGALVLSLFSVGFLIYYVHHIALSMQVAEITGGVARDFERTIERLYPERFGAGTVPPVREPPPLPSGATSAAAPRSGYVQQIDSDAVFNLACEHDTTVWLVARPGDFVVEGARLAAAHPPPRDGEQLARALSETFVFGTDRTSYQDVGFAAQQLVEVALRALSPGVNEPFTAITCIDRLGQGLCKLAARRIPSAVRTDDAGRTRVIARPETFADLVQASFEPIALYADRNPAIGESLLQTLARLAEIARRPEDRAAIHRVADFVHGTAARQVGDERHRVQLARLHAAVQRTLEAA